MTNRVEFKMSSFAETTLQFINSTSGHVFLTGKAGTGKTTFLKNLSLYTHKQFVVVAPTGIAALNAGGVTIHSQFLLPLGTFLPTQTLPSNISSEEGIFTQNILAKKHPLNSVRRQVLRSIDLLVIDEVSMLRADVLDAIDYRLRSVRGNFAKSFGGVQLLLIGDLYQLPPVVRRNEENLMQQYYPSPWFYESRALKQDGFVYIELDKIFRQQDDSFIHILNNLRNNTPTVADIDELNRHYLPEEEISNLEEVITLTTHNYKADEMNKNALRSLETSSHFFEAEIEGEFPESMYPVQSRLELKEGAQIMFIRNDSENQMYFNGKLATVNKISGTSIEVILADSHTHFELKREMWENKKYTVNTDTNDLTDEVIGTFSQYPVKLAWAITVHKSQGLTFDKAIIDVGQAFTGGQVYVALSRLRTLDGLVLRSIIHPGVISADQQVISFSKTNNKPEELPEVMKKRQSEFISLLIEKTFDLAGLTKEIGYISKSDKHTVALNDPSMKPVLEQIATAIQQEGDNTVKFRRQLLGLVKINDREKLLDRLQKGSSYYKTFLSEKVRLLLTHQQEMRQKKRVKTYLNSLGDLDQLFSKKLKEVDESFSLIAGILNGDSHFDFSQLNERRVLERTQLLEEIQHQYPGSKKTSGKKKRVGKKDGRSTYEITLELWGKGMDVESIAKERGLVSGTIEGHLSKAVQLGRISIFQFMSEKEVDEISTALKEMPEGFSSKDLFYKLAGRFSYPKLRAVMGYTDTKP